MIIVGRYINGICLNDLEYLLDGPDGNEIEFESKQAAINFLKNHGATDEEIDYMVFEEINDEDNEKAGW